MKEFLQMLKEYWFIISFMVGQVVVLYKFYVSQKNQHDTTVESTKCSLRNDILDIYDRCKDKKEITHYELESIQHSAELYFKLGGNSFVKDVVKRVEKFELVD